MITKDHMKQVLSGKKRFLKMQEVRFCKPSHYDEIGVLNLYQKVVKMQGMAELFPDKYPKGR